MSSLPDAVARPTMPRAWVERIWAHMRANYGAEFDRLWQCPEGVRPEQHVEALLVHWMGNLAPFAQHPGAIVYALDNLPHRCPNLPEFVALCRRRPDEAVKALEAPPADPARVRDVLGKLAGARAMQPRSARAWAHELRAREQAGRPVCRYAREAWRAALGLPADAPTSQAVQA